MDARQLSALLERLGDADVREVDPSPPADAAIAAFVEGMGAPVTAKGYAQVLRRLARAWPAGTLDQLGVNDVAQWPVQGLNPVTVRHYLTVLAGFVRFCLDRNWLLWSVREERRFESLLRRARRQVRPPRRIAKRPTREMIERLISGVYEKPDTVSELVWRRNVALVETLRCTGMRAAEVVSLTRDALGDQRARVIGKGNRERWVYWDFDAWYALQVYLAATFTISRSAPVFFRHRGTKTYPQAMTGQGVWGVVRSLGERAGVPFHPHLFRHYAISRMAEISVLAAREFAGHDDLTTTSVYAVGQDSETLSVFRRVFG